MILNESKDSHTKQYISLLTGLVCRSIDSVGEQSPCRKELSWLLPIRVPVAVHLVSESQPHRDTHVVDLLHSVCNLLCYGSVD